MAIEYTLDLVIEKPRDAVVALFDNTENMKLWMPEMEVFEPLEGKPGATGSTARMVFNEKGRKMDMVETITANEFPDRFCATYACGKVFNTVENTFTDTSEGHTRWTTHNVFELGGFMRLLGIFMKGAFPKQTMTHMQRFKVFAESSE